MEVDNDTCENYQTWDLWYHFKDELLVLKHVADRFFVHLYFPRHLRNIPLFPNGLSD